MDANLISLSFNMVNSVIHPPPHSDAVVLDMGVDAEALLHGLDVGLPLLDKGHFLEGDGRSRHGGS